MFKNWLRNGLVQIADINIFNGSKRIEDGIDGGNYNSVQDWAIRIVSRKSNQTGLLVCKLANFYIEPTSQFE